MVEAFRESEERQPEVCERIEFRGRVERAICERVVGAKIVGGATERLWNTVCVTLPELMDCRMRWVVRLDAAGIAGSTGSACASGKEEPSHVLRAMGVSPEVAGRTIRLSSGWETPEDVWDQAVEVLGEIHRRFGVNAV
jgi:cysteine desulfurase